jgi:hypothetical protein
MTLQQYLKHQGIVTGPIKKETRHSHLSLIKSMLLGNTISFGRKGYNEFGKAVHELFLQRKLQSPKKSYGLTAEEWVRVYGMVKALDTHPVVTRLVDGGTKEKLRPMTLFGVPMTYTPDDSNRKRKLVNDLKTTVCKSLEDFTISAFKYGYFRQGVTYSMGEKAKDYYIIGINKFPPYTIFLVHLQAKEFKRQMKYVEHELKWLLYFYKNYGTFKVLDI